MTDDEIKDKIALEQAHKEREPNKMDEYLETTREMARLQTEDLKWTHQRRKQLAEQEDQRAANALVEHEAYLVEVEEVHNHRAWFEAHAVEQDAILAKYREEFMDEVHEQTAALQTIAHVLHNLATAVPAKKKRSK
jgi:hypothetical protein